jgi:hypothetical protein
MWLFDDDKHLLTFSFQVGAFFEQAEGGELKRVCCAKFSLNYA